MPKSTPTREQVELGNRIRLSRGELSQKKLAEKIGGTQGSLVGNYESGYREPSLSALKSIAKICKVNYSWLVTGDGVPNGETLNSYTSIEQLDIAASAGPGATVGNFDVVRRIDVLTEWAQKRLKTQSIDKVKVITVSGDSLSGAGINDGDILFVDTAIPSYDGDAFYVFTFRGAFFVKRIQANVINKTLELVSFDTTGKQVNPIPQEEEENLFIQGKVLAWLTIKN